MKFVVVAILIAGAMIAGAIVYVARSNEPRTVEVMSAMDVVTYVDGGWSCEYEGKPIGSDQIELYREIYVPVEIKLGDDYFGPRGLDTPVYCTEPGD